MGILYYTVCRNFGKYDCIECYYAVLGIIVAT